MSQPEVFSSRRLSRPLQAEKSRASRGVLGLGIGLSVLAACLFLGHLGVLRGWGLLVSTALLGLAVPTSRHLAGRIIIGCALFFGAVPLLWWVPRAEGLFSWGHLLFAALLAGLTVRVVTSSRRKAVLSSFLPFVNKADYLILVAGILSVVALAPYFLVFTGPQALGVLLTSWDNSSHFDMYFMLRDHGTVVPMAPLPGGGQVWSFMEYPQGFHAAVATMAELVVGPEKGTLAQELVTYSRLSSLVAVASAMLVTACLTSIPWIRRRPLVSAPFVVFVITAWTFGTAAHATFFAFQNFLLGVALLASLMLIAAFAESLSTPVIFAAAAASVVGIANTWSLLLLLAVPALVLAVHPWITSRWQATRRCWVLNLGSVVGAVVGMVLIAQQISRIGTETVVTAGGRIQSSTHGVEIATLLVAVASSMLLVHGSPRQFFTGLGNRHAAARLVLVPAVGLVAVIAMGTYQIVSMGSVNYYSLKLALAVELLLPLVACITVTALADRWLTTHQYVHPRGLAIMSVLTALASTQVFGLTVPDTRPLGMDPLAPYQKGMAAITSQTLTNGPAASELFQAASAYTSDQGDAVFVTSFDQIDPLLAATWYLSLTGTHKDNTNRILGELRPLYSGYTGNLGRAAENILEADPHVSIVLDRKLRDFLQSSGFGESKLSRLTSHN